MCEIPLDTAFGFHVIIKGTKDKGGETMAEYLIALCELVALVMTILSRVGIDISKLNERYRYVNVTLCIMTVVGYLFFMFNIMTR